MFVVSEIASGSQQSSATQIQMHLIASTALTQRVAAMEAGQRSSDARSQNSGQDAAKLVRPLVQDKQSEAKKEEMVLSADMSPAPEAAMRSIIEAQEASETDDKLIAAFQARFALHDLLSVIRDPNDELLPTAPSETAV
ncbi:MAG: hypothetical protein ABJL99_20070 [Aliishimia sp.]